MAEPGSLYARSVLSRLGGSYPTHGPLGPVVVGRGDRRPFVGDSDVEVVRRIARYVPDDPDAGERPAWSDPVRRMAGFGPDEADGRFRFVKPGALADLPRVYIFVHGWVPGSRDSADEVVIEQGGLPLAWDERIANTVGRTMVSAYEPLLAALVQRDPQAAVLWYSWVDQSGTDTEIFAARSSLGFTGVNGRRLAAALTQLIGTGRPHLHLIGHSHGSVVAAYAALSLAAPVAHLTLLDCPEDWFSRAGGAAGLLTDILPRLRPGRGHGDTFVDAYASMFGRSYHDDAGLNEVVDVRLAPILRRGDQASAVSQAHQYPVEWYTNTVTDPDAPGGFAWSPLHGFDIASLGSAYLATARGRLVEVVRRRQRPTAQDRTITAVARDPVVLTSGSPDVAFMVTLPQDAVLVEFDAAIARAARGSRIDVAVDGRLACSVYAGAPLPARGRFVRVAPGRTVLQFRLVGGGRRTTATVSALRLVRGPDASRNFDDSTAMARAAMLGAAAGTAATMALVVAGAAVRSAVRRRFGAARIPGDA